MHLEYSICLIIPYFGIFQNYFNLFLQSCAANPTINWIIFTDNQEHYDYPDNVKRIFMTFSQMQERVQRKFDFPVVLQKPYKLCDYKVAYGYLFEDELKGYDFWGYCDVDVLFGDLRGFLTEDILSTYDKLGHLGHLTLFRNTEENNRLFMSQIDRRERYKEVFSTPHICVFDEWDYPSINDIFLQKNKRIVSLNAIADIYPNDSYFRVVSFDMQNRKQVFDRRNCLIRWENGHVFLMWKSNQIWQEEECLYVHLQKRNMIYSPVKNKNRFYIIPDRFIDDNISLDTLYSICKKKKVLNIARWKYTYKKYRYCLIEKTGPVRHWFRDKWRKKR